MLVFALTAMLVVVVVFIAYPLWRKTPKPLPVGKEAQRGEERFDLEIEKQNLVGSLRELEEDLAAGKLTPADHARLKNIDEHRFSELLDRWDKTSVGEAGESSPDAVRTGGDRKDPVTGPADALRRFRIVNLTGSLILVLLVAGGAAGIYYYKYAQQQESLQQAAMEGQGPAGAGMGTPPNPLEMVARLERRLRENPNDLQGQIRAGRSYLALQRMDDARKAWSKVIELDPGNPEGHYNLGLFLIQAADPSNPASLQEALNHFDASLQGEPGMPAALFYRGVALIHLKRNTEAEKSWTQALSGLTPGSEDAEYVKEELRKLRAGNPLS